MWYAVSYLGRVEWRSAERAHITHMTSQVMQLPEYIWHSSQTTSGMQVQNGHARLHDEKKKAAARSRKAIQASPPTVLVFFVAFVVLPCPTNHQRNLPLQADVGITACKHIQIVTPEKNKEIVSKTKPETYHIFFFHCMPYPLFDLCDSLSVTFVFYCWTTFTHQAQVTLVKMLVHRKV